MALTFIASAENFADAAGTTLDCSSSLNVAAGDLLVAWCKHEGTNGTFAVAKNSGSPANTFTFDSGDEENHSNSDLNASFGYVLSAAADATATFRLTTESKEFRGIIVWQFRPDSGEVVTKNAAAEGQGTGTSAASGTISPSGSDLVVVGGYAHYDDVTLSNRNINGVAADAFQDAVASDLSSWYRILSSGFSSGTASVTSDASFAWICNVIAFKAAPVSVALTGTATASITETDVVAGGKTIILTVSEDTYVTNANIQYVGGQIGGFAGTTSAQTITFALTNGLASTPAAGDFVVITYFIGSTVDRSLAIRNTSAVDYTLMGSELTQSDNFDANQRTAYRFMPGTPETQFVLTETVGGGTGSTADAGRYTVHVFRNVDTSTPMDVSVVTAGAANSSAVDPGSITPSTTGAWVYVAGGAASGTGSTMTSSDLTDFRAGSTADTNDASIGAGYFVWTSGAFNPAAYGNIPAGTTANSWTAITAALRPSPLFDNARTAIRDGVDSAQSEGTGWDALKSTIMPVGNVVRTSDTVCTITMQAAGTYNITAQETITATVPATALVRAAAVVATPTFTVDTAGGGGSVVKDMIQDIIPFAR